MKKKGLSAIIILSLVVTLLAACTKDKPSSNATDSGQSPASSTQVDSTATPKATAMPETKELVTLTEMVQNHPAQPFKENWLVWDIYRKYAGVNLKVTPYQGDWWDAIPLVIASGDMPDIMWFAGIEFANKYGDQGALVNLLDHLDKMPNLKNWMQQHPVESSVALSSDGKLYMAPSFNSISSGSMMLYRKDILEKNNLKSPANYEELYTVLKALKKLYPESYPMMARGMDAFDYSFAPVLHPYTSSQCSVKHHPISWFYW